ncbi:MAG: hypothetical protein HYX46_05225 [Betaproteobacteria bacterium]|nr:hypothetical protein [Betaproteobacteria bacterium]
MHAAHPRFRQQGIGAVMAVIFLIAAVIFALSQTLDMSGSSSIDNKQQLDSVAALFLAESGLERALGTLSSAGTVSGSVCSGINDGVTYTLGSGRNFKYVSAIPSCSSGNNCGACSGAECTGCSVQVTGNVGSASRTLNLDINLTLVNGKSGFGTDVTMTLKNAYSVPATAVFNLAWRRQGGTTGEIVTGGNASATKCTSCGLQWNVLSSSGGPSAGSLGSSVYNVPAGTISLPVAQTISDARNYAEVGAMFPGISAAPVIIGSYWDDGSGGNGTKTVNNSAVTPSQGQTNSGVATSSTASCLAPSPDHTTNPTQTCTSWCYGADTLVFGVSANSTTFADQITDVTFNTNGNPSQNIALIQIAHFPNTSGIPTSTGDIYSEIWKAYNPNYLSTADASSGGVGTGTIGVASLNATLTNGSNVMLVNSISGTGSVLHVGDTVTCTTGGTCPGFLPATITGQTSGPTGGTGNYTLSANCNNPGCSTRNFRTSSSTLQVTTVSSGYLSVDDTISGTGIAPNTTITSIAGDGSGPGAYGISLPQNVSSTAITAAGATIHVPTGTSVPTSDTPMIVAVRSGTGTFAANTTVLSTPPPTATLFKVSAVPTTRLSAAEICGGTCAFFDNPSSTSSTTQFTISRTPGTNQWGGGFTCLSGVANSKINAVQSSVSSASIWREVVQ